MQDPDTKEIEQLCKALIGSKINLYYTICYKDGSSSNNKLDNCNIIGDCLESILFPYLNNKIKTLEEGPKQQSPDFYNRNKEYEWELKTFKGSPCFDISNYNSYIFQLSEDKGVERKLYKTKYLIFKYKLVDSDIIIEDFKLCNVWDLISYEGKYPISIQNKKGTWYNIRPCSFNDIGVNKNAGLFIDNICESIKECPNFNEDKNTFIENIKSQFESLSKNDML